MGLDMSPFRRGGASTPTGLWTPLTGSNGQDPGQRYTPTFVTYSELGGGPVDQRWITSRLEKMSAYDCLQMLGRLSCMIDAAPLGDLQQQLRVMGRLNWPETVKQAAAALLTDGNGGTRSMFFPQQVVHLARLAVLHADPRAPDDFANGALANDFIQCVLAVTELLGEDLRLDREEQVVSFILRQTAINHRPDSVALWTRYYDIFARTWDEVATAEAFDAAAAFEHYTGISLQRWLMVGFAIYTQFLGYGSFRSEDYLVVPRDFFANTPVEQVEWDAVLAQTAVTLDEARAEIITEEARLGPTVYRCQAFEQRPLLQMPGEAKPLVPFAIDSFERHMTEGIFWVLSDAAMAEGKPREHFTGAFGQVFEEWVQRTFERAIPTVGVKRVHRARPYQSRHGNVDSTDVVLDYEPEAVFIEVVSKRQQTATLTRGDYAAFSSDLEAGVLKKAKQLDRNITDFRSGTLVLDTMDRARITTIFPVILAIEGFPSMPPMPQIIAREIGRRGLLTGLPPVALLGAEELAAIEALMEQGANFAELMRRWKVESGFDALPFANFIDLTPDLRSRATRRSRYQDECWGELMGSIRHGLFHPADRPDTD